MILLGIDGLLEPSSQRADILSIIHLIDYLSPVCVLDAAVVLYRVAHLDDLSLALEVILLSQEDLEQVAQSVPHVDLDEPEVFVALILENLGEERHLVVVSQVCLDRVDDGRCPFDDEVLEAVLLVEISVHELLHCLDREPAVSALLVVPYLLLLHVRDHVLQLLQREHLVGEGRGSLVVGQEDRGLLRVDRGTVEVVLVELGGAVRCQQVRLGLLRAALVQDLMLLCRYGSH